MPKAMMLIDSDKLREVATYVGETQGLIQKHAQVETALQALAPDVVDRLVRQGQVSMHLKEAKLKSFVDDPQQLCEAMVKLASLEPAATLGSGVEIDKSASMPERRTANQVFDDSLFATRS